MLPNNIYLLLGVPCSGKTTVAEILSEKHGMYYFSGDKTRFDYFKKANNIHHPAMSKDMSDYYDLPLDTLIQWEQGVIKEQTPMIIKDLKELSLKHEKIIFEGILDLDFIDNLISRSRIMYMLVSQKIMKCDFYNRKDHIKMLENIKNRQDISDFEKERRIKLRRDVAINFCSNDVSKYNITQFVRYDNTEISEVIKFTERHYELISNN